MKLLSRLATHLGTYESVLVGYSGGVDSALLTVVARRELGRDRAVAALGVSPSLSGEQRHQARTIAQLFDVLLVEIETQEFDDVHYVANPKERCYYCKRELWSRLRSEADGRGLCTVLDGTNAGDRGEHRPGARAGREAGIRSPLAELGFAKADVRHAARALGIPIWNAPAAPCLASRVLYGLAVTPTRVGQVEAGEELLRRHGVKGDLRVRHRGDEARIEVLPSEMEAVRRNRVAIGDGMMGLGFRRVTLDTAGYRRGSLLHESADGVELLATRS